MSFVSDINDTALVIWMTRFSANAIPATAAMAFGPIAMLPKVSTSGADFISDPKSYRPKWSTKDSYAVVGVVLSKLIDRWLISQGGVSLASARMGRLVMAGQRILPLVSAASAVVPTVAISVVALGAYNVAAPPPPEYQHVNSPWYFSVAQALVGGFGIGTAGSQFV